PRTGPSAGRSGAPPSHTLPSHTWAGTPCRQPHRSVATSPGVGRRRRCQRPRPGDRRTSRPVLLPCSCLQGKRSLSDQHHPPAPKCVRGSAPASLWSPLLIPREPPKLIEWAPWRGDPVTGGVFPPCASKRAGAGVRAPGGDSPAIGGLRREKCSDVRGLRGCPQPTRRTAAPSADTPQSVVHPCAIPANRHFVAWK